MPRATFGTKSPRRGFDLLPEYPQLRTSPNTPFQHECQRNDVVLGCRQHFSFGSIAGIRRAVLNGSFVRSAVIDRSDDQSQL